MAGWIKMPLGMEVGLGPGDFVSVGDPAHPPLKGHNPQFSAHVRCGQTAGIAGWNKMPLCMEVGLGPGHIVLDGDPSAPPNKGGRCPQFSARFYSGQTAGCIKMPLGMEVGLGPGHIVLDGGSTPPPQKGGTAPFCGPCLLWPNGRMDQDATCYGGRRHLGDIVVDGDPAPHSPSLFGPCSLWPNGWMD